MNKLVIDVIDYIIIICFSSQLRLSTCLFKFCFLLPIDAVLLFLWKLLAFYLLPQAGIMIRVDGDHWIKTVSANLRNSGKMWFLM